MSDKKVTPIAPLHKLLRTFLENTTIDLGQHSQFEVIMSHAASDYGVQAADIYLVQVGEKHAIGFRDPSPQGGHEWITVSDAANRDWVPFSRSPKRHRTDSASKSEDPSVFFTAKEESA